MLIPKDQAARATEAIKGAEIERRNKILRTLDKSGVASCITEAMANALVEDLVAASSQAPTLRTAAEAAGKGPLAEILTKVADKLEGR